MLGTHGGFCVQWAVEFEGVHVPSIDDHEVGFEATPAGKSEC